MTDHCDGLGSGARGPQDPVVESAEEVVPGLTPGMRTSRSPRAQASVVAL
ncbi:hypothetical protein [Frondihabitans sucicola]